MWYNCAMDLKNFVHDSSPWLGNPAYRYPGIIERPSYDEQINLDNEHVQVLLGARRIGKTYVMRQLINRLLDTKAHVYFVSADNPLLSAEYFYELIDKITQPSGQRLYVFIDEIQDMPGWQKVIKHFYDTRGVKFIVSGSSSLIINQESAKLTGRHQLINIWPLDYREAQDFDPKITLDQYLQDGGYPEIVLGKIEPSRIIDIVESTLFRDLLSLYQIRNPQILGELVKILAAKVGTPVSFATLAKDLGADDQTIAKIINYLVGMRLLIELPIFSRSAKVQLRNPSKYYFIDSGIVHKYSLQPKLGLLAENVVAVQLERWRLRQHANWGYQLVNGQEIDFCVAQDRYEVKYRQDWQTFTDRYEPAQDLGGTLTMIIPASTTIEHPNQTYIGLAEFLLDKLSSHKQQ